MENNKQISFFRCENCGSMFKKECPSNIVCPVIEKCSKCNSKMTKIQNLYNQSKKK